jgi:hypothetical protein
MGMARPRRSIATTRKTHRKLSYVLFVFQRWRYVYINVISYAANILTTCTYHGRDQFEPWVRESGLRTSHRLVVLMYIHVYIISVESTRVQVCCGPQHEPISDFGQGLPPGLWVRNTRPPWSTTHSNRKQYQEGGPSERTRTGLYRRPRVSAPVCHARARAQQRTTITTAVRRGFVWFCPGVRHGLSFHRLTFGVAVPASASQHITSAGTQPSASPRRPAHVSLPRPESL